jgi:hypothetical protein
VTAPEVVQLKQAPIKAIQPTEKTVEVAAVVTPPPAVELKPDVSRHRWRPRSANLEPAAVDRDARTAGFGRGLGPPLVQKRVL